MTENKHQLMATWFAASDFMLKPPFVGGAIPPLYRRDDEREPRMTSNDYSTDTNSQRQRLLTWLLTGPISTLQARKELDIFHPAARIQELRDQGHKIITHWKTVDTGKAKHRIASYVLLTEV